MTRGRPHRGSERGIALVMVLWIFMILTIIVAEFGRTMRDDAIATQNLAEEVQARGVAIAGLNRALYRALREREYDPEDLDDAAGLVDENGEPIAWKPDGRWVEEAWSGGRFAVRIVDEGGKIPLNRVHEIVLRHVFENLGLDPDVQSEIVDAILDWRDDDDLSRLHGAEEDYYLGLMEPYRPKNGPFDSVDELLLVRGVTRDLLYGPPPEALREDSDLPPPIALADIFSVFNRSARVNIRTASPEVLEALVGDGGGELVDIIDTRDEILDGEDEDDDEEAQDTVLALLRAQAPNRVVAATLVDRAPMTLTIETRAVMDHGQVEARVGAVVEIDEDADGFEVMRWLDRLPAF